MEKIRTTVRIAGKEYTIASTDSEAYVNRVAAWVIGTRNMQKALLIAMLEPYKELTGAENSWDFSGRMAIQEAAKTLPWGAVWSYFCEKNSIPQDMDVREVIRPYEENITFKRG